MKSFADWTDEIRAMMNPPKRSEDPQRFQWPPAGFDCKPLPDDMPFLGGMIAPKLDWQKELMGKLYEIDQKGQLRWHKEEELRRRGLIPSVAFTSGRQMGKSAMLQVGTRWHTAVQKALELSAKHGNAWVGYDYGDFGASKNDFSVVVTAYNGEVIHREIIR